MNKNTDKDGVSNLYIDGVPEPTDVQSPAPLLGLFAAIAARIVMKRR